MPGRMIALTVNVNLDPVPGTFHDEADAQRQVQRILDQAIPHYFPGVSLYNPPAQPDPNQGLLPLGDWRHPRRAKNWIATEYFANPLQEQQPEGD